MDSGHKKDLVFEFCRASAFAGIMRPSKGRGVGAGKVQWGDFRQRDGETLGFHWTEKKTQNLRVVDIDTNFWKTTIKGKLRQAKGEKGAITFFADDDQHDHAMLRNHLTSEYGQLNTVDGVSVEEWTRRPDGQNHLLDCFIGSAAAASLEGIRLVQQQAEEPKKKAKLRFATRAEWLAWKSGG